VEPYGETWRGFFASREAREAPAGVDLVWRRTPYDGCQVHEFAGRGGPEERDAVAKALMADAQGEILALDDAARGTQRRAVIEDGKPERVLVMTAMGTLPARGWIADRFLDDALALADRVALLAGRSAATVDVGTMVCACMKVGSYAIDAAIAEGCATVEAVGQATFAGTNCGSCRPEIAAMLKAAAAAPKETADAA
jgi:assimilatory nitrate reductase catalytic subunit